MPVTGADKTELLELAVHTAARAGDLLLQRFGGSVGEVDTKSSPTDPVSAADRASERLLVELIAARRPNDGIVAEEGGRETTRSGITWVIDPLDGTVNFLSGIPWWCVSVAARDEHGGVVGVIHDPIHQETFSAARRRGATLNGRPIRASTRDDLATSLVATGFAYSATTRARQALVLPRLLPEIGNLRRFGSAALDMAWVACGRIDGYFESSMKLWDRAAGDVIVTEAGGVVSDLVDPGDEEAVGVVAAGAGIHDRLRALVVG